MPTLRQMGGVAQQRGALVQRLAHQGDVALREVAHAAVYQLGGTRGGALAKSCDSSSTTEKPRAAASSATPRPVAPPPTTARS